MNSKSLYSDLEAFFKALETSSNPLEMFKDHYDQFKDLDSFLFFYSRSLFDQKKYKESGDMASQIQDDGGEFFLASQDLLVLVQLMEYLNPKEKLDKYDAYLAKAALFFSQGHIESCLEELSQLLFRKKDHQGELAKKSTIAILNTLPDGELRETYQRRLSMAIYS